MDKKTEYQLKDSNGSRFSVYRDCLHVVIFKSEMENVEVDEYGIDDLISSLQEIKKEIKEAKQEEIRKSNKDVVNTEKTICVNCSHYEKQGEDDACCLEEPDYVHGGMRQVCDFCRDINTNGNCKYYKEQMYDNNIRK